MRFCSILFNNAEDRVASESASIPDYFVDLNLDQVVRSITVGKQEYHLEPFFYTPLRNLDGITYRHEVMRDMENPALFRYIIAFAAAMRTMREQLELAKKMTCVYQKESWFLDAVHQYIDTVEMLARDLCRVEARSRGFRRLREYVSDYSSSKPFTTLRTENEAVWTEFRSVRYCLLIRDNWVKVRKYEDEADYSTDVVETFQRFQQGAVKEYRAEFSTRLEMNHVEAGVLDLVAKLYPEAFLHLDQYYTAHSDFLDDIIAGFDREIQFYIAYMEYIAALKRAGLKFCYPCLADASKAEYDYEGFDIALAYKLTTHSQRVVTNDYELNEPERIFVISGPNQGGKTTFARAFGQLHYLVSIGCPVPGRAARLFVCDQLFTHFEREEHLDNLRGKLQDDLVRIERILRQATPKSVIILNEIFSSTTLMDAMNLGKKIIEKIAALDLLCVCVTFIDELSTLNVKTVSMVSTIMPDTPKLRTFKIVRKPADGRLYALLIAEKYGLTYQALKERISS